MEEKKPLEQMIDEIVKPNQGKAKVIKLKEPEKPRVILRKKKAK